MGRMTVAGHPLIVFPRLESTNAEAARMVEKGIADLTPPIWIITHRQTAGKGRLGRQWKSRDGDLTATCLIRPDIPEARISELSFVAALAAFDMAAALIGSGSEKLALTKKLALKWPNDLLFGGKKLAGLLLESAGEGWVAMGVGVNLAGPVQFDGAVSIADITGRTPGNMVALESLARAMDLRMAQWHGGFDAVRQAWLDRAADLGDPVRVRAGRQILEGRFEGLDDSGAMRLMTDNGRRLVSAGDVFPANTAGAAQ